LTRSTAGGLSDRGPPPRRALAHGALHVQSRRGDFPRSDLRRSPSKGSTTPASPARGYAFATSRGSDRERARDSRRRRCIQPYGTRAPRRRSQRTDLVRLARRRGARARLAGASRRFQGRGELRRRSPDQVQRAPTIGRAIPARAARAALDVLHEYAFGRRGRPASDLARLSRRFQGRGGCSVVPMTMVDCRRPSCHCERSEAISKDSVPMFRVGSCTPTRPVETEPFRR
jgi:hypothetical protein